MRPEYRQDSKMTIAMVVGVVIKEDGCAVDWNGEGQEDLEVKRGYYNRVPVNFPARFSLFRFSPIHQSLLNC
jgi:hypothetical protein